MIQQLNQLEDKILQKKKTLTKFKITCLTKIYKGLVNKEAHSKIHHALLLETINYKVIDKYIVSAIETAYKKALQKQTQESDKYDLAVLLFILFDKLSPQIDKVINKYLLHYEGEEKKKIINNYIKDNEEIGQVFYLASSHNDCAADHLDYQKKIYIDEKWQSIIKTDKIKKKIDTYINTHKTKTIQWVTDAPVYFITRPYCRHFMEKVNINDVLRFSVNTLVVKYKTHKKRGNRTVLQIPKIKNANLALQKYQERLALHKMMEKQFSTVDIKRAIEKDKFLIDKWKKYILVNTEK